MKWRQLSSSDEDAIAQWWSQYPDALPAIDLEKCELLVLDGDQHGGPDGYTALWSCYGSSRITTLALPRAH